MALFRSSSRLQQKCAVPSFIIIANFNQLCADPPCQAVSRGGFRHDYRCVSAPVAAYSRRVLSLPAELCHVAEFATPTLLECAQSCALRLTSCYTYGYQQSSGTCSFHRLLASCARATVLQPGVAYYRLSRACT